jgi:hypothetical protein
MGDRQRRAKRRLRAHDAGSDRHSKAVAYVGKLARMAQERARVISSSPNRKKRKKV